MPTCLNCNDEGWVCENHPSSPWMGGDATCCKDEDPGREWGCGAGAPCKVCNPSDRDNMPRNPAGFRVVCDKDGYRH